MKYQQGKGDANEERKRLAAIASRKAMQEVLDKQMKELEERKKQEVSWLSRGGRGFVNLKAGSEWQCGAKAAGC